MSINKNKLSRITKNYIKIPNKILRMGLSTNCISIYLCLAAVAEDFHPSITFLCKLLKLSRPTTIKSLKTLQECGIIELVEKGGFFKKKTSNKYALRPVEFWKEIEDVHD